MVFEASQNWERNSRYPINLRVRVIKLLQGEKFRENALTHGNKTQVEMALLWDGEISARTISRALKKSGFTRKKNLPLRKRVIEQYLRRKLETSLLPTLQVGQVVVMDNATFHS